MSSKVDGEEPLSGLAEGQIWQLKHVYIQIVDLGKRLLQYRMMDSPDQSGVKTQVSATDVMWRYLKTRHARLVNAGAEN